jgi:hypothetical protein
MALHHLDTVLNKARRAQSAERRAQSAERRAQSGDRAETREGARLPALK